VLRSHGIKARRVGRGRSEIVEVPVFDRDEALTLLAKDQDSPEYERSPTAHLEKEMSRGLVAMFFYRIFHGAAYGLMYGCIPAALAAMHDAWGMPREWAIRWLILCPLVFTIVGIIMGIRGAVISWRSRRP